VLAFPLFHLLRALPRAFLPTNPNPARNCDTVTHLHDGVVLRLRVEAREHGEARVDLALLLGALAVRRLQLLHVQQPSLQYELLRPTEYPRSTSSKIDSLLVVRDT
jgi:hypothetical protein